VTSPAIDEGKVPPGFPRCYAEIRIYSDGGRPIRPYYKARDVWRYFKKMDWGSFDPVTGEPWRCSGCAFYGFCRMGRCVAFIPLEFFTTSEITGIEAAFREIPYHESGGGFTLGWSEKDDEEDQP